MCADDTKSEHEFFRGSKHEQDDIDSGIFRLASSRALEYIPEIMFTKQVPPLAP